VLPGRGVAELAGPEAAAGAAALLDRAGGVTAVIASAATARQLAARFDVAAPGLDGARRVVGVRPVAAGAGVATYRARELAAVDGHLERSFRERVPVCVEIRGAAGSGKTRLREALIAAVGARREVEWLVAVASPVGAPAPLATLAAASPEWYEAATGGGAITDPQRRHTAARRWLEARATRRPVVVIVEDVQWADPSTRALLDHLRAGLDDVPVGIVSFLRDDTGGTAPAPPGVEVVTLGPLDDTAARELARSIAPSASSAVIAGIVSRAAGNPFFVEELAREVADRVAATDDGPSAATLVLPPSIEAVIQARLDHLPEPSAQVALAAAVIGRAFWRSAVAALVPLDDAVLDAALADLERRGVVTATAPVTLDDDRYQFTQGLVRDAAYARIPPRDRRAHHAQVAAWLEAHPTRDDVAMALDAAYHREQAGDTAGAAAAYRRAGEKCLAVFANGEAARALERAIALVATPDAALLEAHGDALAETAGPTAAEAAYAAASAALAGADDTPPARARLACKLAVSASRRGDHQTALQRYDAGLALAAPGGTLAPWAAADPRVAAKLFGGKGWTLGYQLGRVDEGHPLCERAVALLEGTPHRRDLAHALSRLGGTYMRACRYADQLRTNQRNLDIGRELGDLNMQLTANINLGVVHLVLGAVDDAIATTTAARALAAKTGAAASAGLAASNLAGYLIECDRLDEAEAALDEALELIDRTGSRYILCESYQFQARIAAARGDLVAARHHIERSRALAKELNSPLDEAVATRILAQIASRAGDHAEARRLVDGALAAAAAVDAFEAARTRAARARILAAAGDASAPALFAEARAELTRLGARRELEVLEVTTEVR
jgi:tetratricopeptide (TPR) repeat protein